MAIEIKKEPKIFFQLPAENCIFCKTHTRYWNLNFNFPICPVCAPKHNLSEIKNN